MQASGEGSMEHTPCVALSVQHSSWLLPQNIAWHAGIAGGGHQEPTPLHLFAELKGFVGSQGKPHLRWQSLVLQI